MTKALPFLVVLGIVLLLWYTAALVMDTRQLAVMGTAQGGDTAHWLTALWAMDRPVLPMPDRIMANLAQSIFGNPLSSPRNFLLQTFSTAETATLGLLLGLVFGLALAISIVHVSLLERTLMPWIIASQTIPILAIAPMVVVALGNIGITGLVPKAAIVGYLCFFPVTIGMVKGLRSPDAMQQDLMRIYDANRRQIFGKLLWPVALPQIFPSLKVAVALAVTGAIVAELPTGAQSGLGARLLAGSYYGQTLMMWDALFMAALLAMILIGLVRVGELMLQAHRGGRL